MSLSCHLELFLEPVGEAGEEGGCRPLLELSVRVRRVCDGRGRRKERKWEARES